MRAMELQFISWLRERLAGNSHLAPLGFRDDAAWVRLQQGERTVVTVDMLTDGVDFDLRVDAAERVGRKALAVNLSDLAAMAARPLAAVVALALPREGALPLAQRIYEGLLPLADEYGLQIVGGDTNTWDGPLAISVTAMGEAPPNGPLTRTGAQPGDAIVVTGRFGGSRLGHQFDFQPRVREAAWLVEHAEVHAGMDVSDGLTLDLWRLCQASGVGAEIDTVRIPVSPDAARWAVHLADGSTPLEHALGDGEDFELLLTMPAGQAARLETDQPLECGMSTIGRVTAEPGLWQIDARGIRSALVAVGFEH
jgi:thiamine-monophosphate kinase